jgi:hypothetical protein
MPNLFTEYLKTNPKLKEQQNQVNFFDNVSDFATNWKSKQFNILPIQVSNKSRWALIVVNNSDQVYPFFYNSLNWSGNDTTHNKERDEVASQLKPILGNCDNTWITGTSYNNYVVSEGSNNPDLESNQAYILSSLEKILDLIKSKPEAFKIKSGWNNNDFGTSIQPNSQDIANSKVKNQLGQWTQTFPNLTPEAVKKIYDQPKEAHTDKDLKPKDLPDNWAEQLANLNKWTSTFGNQKPDEVKKNVDALNQRPNISQADYDKIKGQLEQANKDNQSGDEKYKSLETKNKDDLKTIESLREQLKTAQEAQKQAEKERDTATEATKTANNKITSLNDSLKSKDGEITNLKEQVKQDQSNQSNQATQSTQYLNKLLAIYKQQITEATQTFYLNDLGLDESDDIRPSYNGVDYLTLLDKLNGETDPDNVISSFKLVALICATKKAQSISDKWKDKVVAKNKRFRANELKRFENIKRQWELNKDLNPTEVNNPLFLSIIKDKETYKTQIENIIKLWQ